MIYLKSIVKKVLKMLNLELRTLVPTRFPPELSVEEIRAVKYVKNNNLTMGSIIKLIDTAMAVKYIIKNNISGDFVECGVWKGGSIMAMIYKLLELNILDRKIWAFDTYEGMTEPGDDDIDFQNKTAKELMDQKIANILCISSYEETTTNILNTGYPHNMIQFVKGRVEETIPRSNVEQIALLRLDTDWYESTMAELNYFYPKLVKGGVLIIDDYGHWKGCKKAVDEYFHKINEPVHLDEIDYTGRVFYKS
jgi:hypothetical protein